MTSAYELETKRMGMWVFLSMEALFFGGIFFLYLNERHFYPVAFEQGSQLLDLKAGTLNTAVLLTSSLAMALAVHFMQRLRSKATIVALLTTAALGIVFLGVKAYEFYDDYKNSILPGVRFALPTGAPKEVQLFLNLYLFAVSLHALHLIIGIGWSSLLSFFIWRAARHRSHEQSQLSDWIVRTEVMGLYWHFVDIIWIFLFPLFYLIGSRQ